MKRLFVFGKHFCVLLLIVPLLACGESEIPSSAVCGSADGRVLSAAPTSDLCDSGTESDVSGEGPWNWTCQGSDDGTSAECTAHLAGSCGAADGQTLYEAPTSGLCNTGTESDVTDEGPWSWTCEGSDDGTSAECTAHLAGSCGYADGRALPAEPTSGLCDSGTESDVSGEGPWSWTCEGSDDGTSAECTVHLAGSCGAADGQTLYEAPTSELCDSGTESDVSDEGPWSWTCDGSDDGTSAECTAHLAGSCGYADGRALPAEPTSGLCDSGTESDVSGEGPWSWTCDGSDDGTSANCTAHLAGSCGVADGNTFDEAPTSDLCESGTESDISGEGPWSWTCDGSDDGTSADCTAYPPGECGWAHGQMLADQPTFDLCNSGTAGAVSGDGVWTWTCHGSPNDNGAACAAWPTTFECSVQQGFGLQGESPLLIGFINGLKFGFEDLPSDLVVADPENADESLNVVAVLSSIHWDGEYNDPIDFDARVSTQNKNTLAGFYFGMGPPDDVQFEFTVYAYDAEQDQYFRVLHTGGEQLFGMIAKAGGELLFSVDLEQATEVLSPDNYAFQMSVMPDAQDMDIFTGSSATHEISRDWGLDF